MLATPRAATSVRQGSHNSAGPVSYWAMRRMRPGPTELWMRLGQLLLGRTGRRADPRMRRRFPAGRWCNVWSTPPPTPFPAELRVHSSPTSPNRLVAARSVPNRLPNRQPLHRDAMRAQGRRGGGGPPHPPPGPVTVDPAPCFCFFFVLFQQISFPTKNFFQLKFFPRKISVEKSLFLRKPFVGKFFVGKTLWALRP